MHLLACKLSFARGISLQFHKTDIFLFLKNVSLILFTLPKTPLDGYFSCVHATICSTQNENKMPDNWPDKWLGIFMYTGIYNPRVTKQSYKTDLRIMTWQTELLTLIFFFYFFELVTRCEKNFNIILELVTRDF